MRLDDQLSGLVEAGIRAVGPLDTGDKARQETPAETLNLSRCSPLVSIPTIPASVRP